MTYDLVFWQYVFMFMFWQSLTTMFGICKEMPLAITKMEIVLNARGIVMKEKLTALKEPSLVLNESPIVPKQS